MTDLNLSIDEAPLVFVDFETTGLDPAHGDRVCEIGLLGARGDTVEIEWSRLVNPQRGIGYGAYRVNGISDEMVADAPPFGEVVDELIGLLHGRVLVAHNALFDLAFLKAELELTQRPFPSLVALDTLRLARLNVTSGSYSLASLCAMYGIEQDGAHRALADVRATHQLFRRLVRVLRARGACSVADVIRAQGGVLRDRTASNVQVPPVLRDALRQGSLLRIRYSDARGAVTERVIRPIELSARYGQLYLVAHCFLRNGSRTFALDRIVEMYITTESPAERY